MLTTFCFHHLFSLSLLYPPYYSSLLTRGILYLLWHFLLYPSSTFSDCWVCQSGSWLFSACCPVYVAPPSETLQLPLPPSAQPASWFVGLETLLRNTHTQKHANITNHRQNHSKLLNWLPGLVNIWILTLTISYCIYFQWNYHSKSNNISLVLIFFWNRIRAN